ncbi:MAG: PKD domain-containing protein, partial [Candidatus Hodarchaeota archaeon]
GSNSTIQNPSKLFPDAGTYNVSLEVSDEDGDIDTRSILITVTEDTGNENGNGDTDGNPNVSGFAPVLLSIIIIIVPIIMGIRRIKKRIIRMS